MSDPVTLATIFSSAMIGIAIVTMAGLRGWAQWLELRRLEVEGRRRRQPSANGDIEALKARVRRLEAIASGSER